MKVIVFIFNLPFTLIGLVPLILSGPYNIRFIKNPIALVCQVKSFRGVLFINKKKARALTIGHIILLGPKVLPNDLEHEIIHVKQCDKYPVIYPFLYLYELLTKGYRHNRFEEEAYTLSNSTYKGESK